MTQVADFRLESPAFEHADPIPDRYMARHEGGSPPLSWSGVPMGTRSLVLLVENPDTGPEGRTHWLVYNIPPTRGGLPESVEHRGDLSDGTLQGVGDFDTLGWHGPNPRPGAAARFRFVLIALDTALPLGAGATRETVERAMAGHVLASTQLTVTASTPLFTH